MEPIVQDDAMEPIKDTTKDSVITALGSTGQSQFVVYVMPVRPKNATSKVSTTTWRRCELKAVWRGE